MDAMVGFTK